MRALIVIRARIFKVHIRAPALLKDLISRPTVNNNQYMLDQYICIHTYIYIYIYLFIYLFIYLSMMIYVFTPDIT